jgi:hypothetical protein
VKEITYEYLVPTEILMFDTDDWPRLSSTVNGIRMQIRKPIIGHGLLKPAESLGNEGLDIRYTIFRVDLTIGENDAPPEWYLPFSAVKLCLSWVRVAGRQYWVGVLMGAANNLARGTLLQRIS